MDCSKINSKIAFVFDFDGTMCQLFKHYDLDKVVVSLHNKMKEYDIEFLKEKDSFDVFLEIIRQTDDESKERINALIDADQILTAAEIEAVNTSERVEGVNRIIPFLKEAGFPVGIATNNSVKCVKAFVQKNCPDVNIPIVGRVGTKPELMKPNAWSLLEVLREMDCLPENVIFVGDTLRDYSCAKNVGCMFIGMAPTDKKRQRLLHVIPESDIVSNFDELLRLLKITDENCIEG